jgi:hypothetical protein
MRHPKSKATNPKPFSFAGYEFQKKIADDMHPDLSVIKVSQVGLTEIQVRKFLGILKRFGPLTGIFTLPNDEMYERVSKARVGPIVNEEAILNQPNPSKPIRSMALYQIDNSFGYFTGNKESDATSIPGRLRFPRRARSLRAVDDRAVHEPPEQLDVQGAPEILDADLPRLRHRCRVRARRQARVHAQVRPL